MSSIGCGTEDGILLGEEFLEVLFSKGSGRAEASGLLAAVAFVDLRSILSGGIALHYFVGIVLHHFVGFIVVAGRQRHGRNVGAAR